MPPTATWLLAIILAVGQSGPLRQASASPAQTQPAQGAQAPSARQAETRPQWPASSEAYQTLQALDATIDGAPAASPPPVAGIDLEDLAPLDADDPARPKAELPLADALAECAVPHPTPPKSPPPSQGAVVRAARLYASGVARLIDGDAPAAARDLAGAAKLDPNAEAPWLRLAEAQAAMGQNGAAMLSYKRAADLGSQNPLALGALGIQSARTGQQPQAANYLARCLAAGPERADPLLRNVALANIAGPLRQSGYLQASIDAIKAALDLPRRLESPTRFGEDANEIIRRASDLWRDMGDAACRLGQDDLAAQCYERAAALPTLDPSAILVRRAYVLLRSGRTGAAALLLLDDVAARGGRADARHLGLLTTLRDEPKVGPLTVRALEDLANSLPRPLAPSTASAITLAKAAAAPDAGARDILTAHLREYPQDRAVLATLMARLERDQDRTNLALELIAQAPEAAPEAAALLAAWHAGPYAIIDNLPNSEAGQSLRTWLLLGWGRPMDVLAPRGQMPNEPGAGDADGWSLAVRGVADAMAGAWEDVDRILGRLPSEGRAAAEVCRAAQRYPQALRALEPRLGADASVPDLLRGSELALGAGDPDRSEALLLRAKALDPFEEGAYEGLLAVYQSRGDERQAATIIRELRERVPSSHLLRWVNAQELAQRGQLDEAERTLRDLIDDSPENPNAFGLLLQIWQQRARSGDTESLNDAESWVGRRAASRPFSPDAIGARSRLLVMLMRQDEASGIIESALAARPSPTLARVREDLVRSQGDQQRADSMALERLDAAGHGIDPSLERAEILVRADRLTDAASSVVDALPAGSTLTAPQRNRLLGVVSAMGTKAAGGAGSSAEVLGAMQRVEQSGIELPWQIQFARWTLLSREPGAAEADIAAAASSFVAAVPSLEAARSLIRPAPGQRNTPIDTLDQARAEIAYEVANALFSDGHEPASLELFGLALKYNPEHVWAANDLGYFLVERGERLDEATRMLETAFAGAPAEANIADSLGWLRYKLGDLRDTTRADGSKQEGAISLLTTATTLTAGAENPTIYDHLGDALWRAGEHDRAQAMWLRAQQLLVQRLTQLRGEGNDVVRARVTEAANLTGSKLDAVRAGREPQVAPLMHE